LAELFFKKYINNISGLQSFQLMRFCTLLLISIVFAQSGVATGQIGLYEVFLFVTALVCSFWVNGIIQSFLPLYESNRTFEKQGKKSPEIFNVFLLISLLSLIIVAFLASFKNSFENTFTPGAEIPFLGLMLCYIIFNCPSFLIEYIYLVRNEPTKIIRYGLIAFSIQLILVTLPLALGYDMYYSVLGLVLASLFRYLWLIVLLRKYALFRISFDFIKEHLQCAWPLVVSTLMSTSAQYVDSFLVLNRFDSTTFAIFKYGAREFPLILLMATALSTAMIPEFSNNKNIGDALLRLKKKSANLMHLLFPISIVFLFASEWIYPRLFNENFSESARIFNIYLLLIISRLVFPHSILIGLKRTKIVMYASFAELVCNISLSVIFIQFWGIEGIAFATIIAYLVQKVIWIFYISTRLKIPVKQYIPLVELFGYSVLLIVTFIVVFFV
jgi:O-antigen/teichoic acid export membrane protein